MPEQIPFFRLVVRTTKVLAELVEMSVLDVASQATKSKTVLSQILRVSRTVPHLSPVAQISRVPHPVLLVDNSQINFMLSSPGKIRKILLMWYWNVIDLSYACLCFARFRSFFVFYSPYIAVDFGVNAEILVEPFLVSNPIGKTIIARWVSESHLSRLS